MTPKRKAGALYFTGIARVAKEAVILIGNYYALEDTADQRTTLLSLTKGTWGSMDLSGIAHAIRYSGASPNGKKEYLVLERSRRLYRISPPAQVHLQQIAEKRQGFLMDIRRIGSKWYSVGGHHQIYQGNGRAWEPIDEGIYIPGEKGDTKTLLSIHGLSESEIYSVGFDGVIFQYNGKKWRQLDSPTNVGLQRVLCVTEEEVYICGNAKGLYRGNARQWFPLTQPDEKTTFWDMAFFQGAVYVCTKKKLFVIRDQSLEEVKIPVKGPLGFYRMDADDDELWTCGNECLLQFDGKTWKQHIFPDNT